MTIRFEAAGAEFIQARCEVVARWSSVGYLNRLSDDLKVLAGRELGPRSYRGWGALQKLWGLADLSLSFRPVTNRHSGLRVLDFAR